MFRRLGASTHTHSFFLLPPCLSPTLTQWFLSPSAHGASCMRVRASHIRMTHPICLVVGQDGGGMRPLRGSVAFLQVFVCQREYNIKEIAKIHKHTYTPWQKERGGERGGERERRRKGEREEGERERKSFSWLFEQGAPHSHFALGHADPLVWLSEPLFAHQYGRPAVPENNLYLISSTRL